MIQSPRISRFHRVFHFIVIACLVAGAPALPAQDRTEPLIQLLIRKGIISDAEAMELRAELAQTPAESAPQSQPEADAESQSAGPRSEAKTTGGKIVLSGAVREVRLKGDVRLRHEVSSRQEQPGAEHDHQVRERFRLRLGADVKLESGWGAGVALETGRAADSSNQTFQDGFDDFGIYLARAYVAYDFNDQWRVVAGKQRNPFVTNNLLWDSDINPQGLVERYRREFGGQGRLELYAAQFIMDDHDESLPGAAGNDAWMFVQQAAYQQKFGAEGRNTIEIAPGLAFYNASSVDDHGAAAGFTGTTRHLSLFNLPVNISRGGLGPNGAGEVRLYGELNYNFDAADRVYDAYNLSRTLDDDPLAWLAGLAYRTGGKDARGTVSMSAEYRSIGIGSLDPNINDSDFGFSHLNQEGTRLTLGYNLTDFADVAATYLRSEAIQNDLRLPSVAALAESEIFFLDLNVRF